MKSEIPFPSEAHEIAVWEMGEFLKGDQISPEKAARLRGIWGDDYAEQLSHSKEDFQKALQLTAPKIEDFLRWFPRAIDSLKTHFPTAGRREKMDDLFRMIHKAGPEAGPMLRQFSETLEKLSRRAPDGLHNKALRPKLLEAWMGTMWEDLVLQVQRAGPRAVFVLREMPDLLPRTKGAELGFAIAKRELRWEPVQGLVRHVGEVIREKFKMNGNGAVVD